MKLSQITIIEAVEKIDFTGIDADIIDKLSPFPPHLQQWAVQEINKGEGAISVVDAVEYYQKYIKDNRFQAILAKITPSPKNILTLSLSQVKDAQAENDEKYHRASNRELKKARKLNYTEKSVDTPALKIIKVTRNDDTDGAAKILSDIARGTKWCVTSVEMGETYLKDGPVYYIELSSEQLLCHVETGQLKKNDDEDRLLTDEEYKTLVPYIKDIALFLEDQNNPAYYPGCKDLILKFPDRILGVAKKIIRRRWPEGESALLKNTKSYKVVHKYCKEVIKGRWPEAEMVLLKGNNASDLTNYAKEVIGDRWPEAEPIIMQNMSAIVNYAIDIIKGRWLEAEPTLLGLVNEYKDEHLGYAVSYAQLVIKSRWPELEELLLKYTSESLDAQLLDTLSYVTEYAKSVIKGRWPEAEPFITRGAYAAATYAKEVLKRRWPEAEPKIMDSDSALSIYLEVVKSRWEAVEPLVLKNAVLALMYTKYALHTRWPEAEPIIMQNPVIAFGYATRIIRGRWPEAEPIIMQSKMAGQYSTFLRNNGLV